MEVVRFTNDRESNVVVNIEPWGSDYEVPVGHRLNIHVENSIGLVEYIYHLDGEVSIFLNDCVFDDLKTNISKIVPF